MSYRAVKPLPEDGIFDEIAVEIAAAGRRQVRLTARELDSAVLICIRELGLTYGQTAERLHISKDKVSKAVKAAII